MARRRRPNGLEDLVRAALVVFAREGFRQAQVADVAREMGVALGTVYGYIESKEALFALVVDRLFAAGGSEPQLPVATPDTNTILAKAENRLRETTALPILEAARRRPRAWDARSEVAEVVNELWEMTMSTRIAADMIERSARDWPELADLFYRQIRRELINRLGDYVDRRSQSGQFCARSSPSLVARTVLETVTWWARHRYRDPELADLPDAQARETIIPLLVDAVIGPEGG